MIDWINDVLVGERIIVKDLAEDLYDGQVLQKLFGKRHRDNAWLCSAAAALLLRGEHQEMESNRNRSNRSHPL